MRRSRPILPSGRKVSWASRSRSSCSSVIVPAIETIFLESGGGNLMVDDCLAKLVKIRPKVKAKRKTPAEKSLTRSAEATAPQKKKLAARKIESHEMGPRKLLAGA